MRLHLLRSLPRLDPSYARYSLRRLVLSERQRRIQPRTRCAAQALEKTVAGLPFRCV